MQIIRGPALAEITQNRIPDNEALPVPDRFEDTTLGIRSEMRYTLERPIGMGHSRSTFWNMPIDIKLLPHTERRSPTSVSSNGHKVPAVIDNVRTGMHNIEVTDGRAGVGILEHPNAVQSALNVDMNIEVDSGQSPILRSVLQGLGMASRSTSLPTNARCNQPYLTALYNNLISTGAEKYVTVDSPVGFSFGKNSYVLLEPDEGRRELIIDQQIEYPDIPPLGNQRMCATITPEFFSFIATARTPAIRTRATVMQMMSGMNMSRFPYSSLGLSNVVVVTKKGIVNPNEKFAEGETNYEVMCHEFIDKLGWLKYIETQFEGRKFVGKITLSRTNHAREIDVARALCGASMRQEESHKEKRINTQEL